MLVYEFQKEMSKEQLACLTGKIHSSGFNIDSFNTITGVTAHLSAGPSRVVLEEKMARFSFETNPRAVSSYEVRALQEVRDSAGLPKALRGDCGEDEVALYQRAYPLLGKQ